MTAELDRAVKTVVRQCMGISPGEDVLVVCNPVTEEIGALMRIEAQGDGADATLAVISERDSAAAEPPRAVAAAMAAADVVLAATIQSLSHTAARKAASDAGVRVGSLPGVTEEMLTRLMTGDLEEIRRRGWAVVTALNRGSQARITCRHGSDLRIGLEGRLGTVDAGELGNKGAFGNLPCGEGFIAPLEGTTEGTLVVDGSIAEVGLLETPVSLTVREGHLVEATGGDGAAADGAAHRPRRRRHQCRRARDRHQRGGDPHRQHPRGREDPRYLPRRLRRLGGDRRHRPGSCPPRLHRPRNRRSRSTARRSSAAATFSSEARGDAAPARGPQRLGGKRPGAPRPAGDRFHRGGDAA